MTEIEKVIVNELDSLIQLLSFQDVFSGMTCLEYQTEPSTHKISSMSLDQSKNILSPVLEFRWFWFYFFNRNTAKTRSKYFFIPSVTMGNSMLGFLSTKENSLYHCT